MALQTPVGFVTKESDPRSAGGAVCTCSIANDRGRDLPMSFRHIRGLRVGTDRYRRTSFFSVYCCLSARRAAAYDRCRAHALLLSPCGGKRETGRAPLRPLVAYSPSPPNCMFMLHADAAAGASTTRRKSSSKKPGPAERRDVRSHGRGISIPDKTSRIILPIGSGISISEGVTVCSRTRGEIGRRTIRSGPVSIPSIVRERVAVHRL